MNVWINLTPAHCNQRVSIPQARTDATVSLVGGTAVIILVLMLMNVPRDGTAVQPTHIALTRKAHTDAIATAVSTDLETDVIVCTF